MLYDAEMARMSDAKAFAEWCTQSTLALRGHCTCMGIYTIFCNVTSRLEMTSVGDRMISRFKVQTGGCSCACGS